MNLEPGAVVSGYTIERQLGSGGMGAVFLARHPSLPRSDALKVLSAELSRDDQFRSRFLREADLAATLDHPNIVRVYTRGQTEDGQLWIAMQFVDGTDADAALRAGTMTPARAVRIVSEVGKALDYAHERNILHRDVKPANFLLAGEPGPRERVLLADFGIARALDDATRLTATGSVMVTVAYASPESLQGQPIDFRSDLYSLGCTLYRLLTGRAPYGADGTTSAVMMAHVSAPPPKITDVMPGLPPAIDEVIAKALAKDPAQRYSSGRELAAAAAAAFGMESQTPVPPPSQFSGPVPAPGQFSGPVPPTGGYPPSGPAYAAGNSGPSPLTYPTSTGAPAPAKKSKKKLWLAAAGVLAVVIAVVAGIALWPSGTAAKGPYPPQNFVHAYGSAKIDARPSAIVAGSLGDADTILSLGLQPVGLVAPGGETPSWLRPLIEGSPTVMGRADADAISQLKPNVIVDTSSDASTYDALSKVAPTVARPAGNKAWTPTARLNWIAQVLGEQTAAAKLSTDLTMEANTVRQQHDFDERTITVFGFSTSGLTVISPSSPTGGYLEGLGFTVGSAKAEFGAGQVEVPADTSTLSDVDSQFVLLLRTDSGARNGGYAGLPKRFFEMRPTVVIVDDAEIISALTSAGPAATRYLNTALVNLLAKQVK
ncbi:serine/threonine-protein kinase [Mycolicibacterium brumae]|uniref:non-specific serine/threonine protein kinase n=1 Tax=Mycolicibacterium brumae TaxID=85968 RepID=A0A2G5PF55_9MYCO|nr:serine/threonine-protein kinase [Mycolicibacterium brumae]MCV7192671.1 protein kinase [Mycolicibacterium brumae]PIB76584.1 hypothetical protein CQY22_005620 [Mycolicibacterium brumae]RWA23255.1 hypothetical protein MBRU_00115 [Mycolicibacterium brumae DSM 44177]